MEGEEFERNMNRKCVHPYGVRYCPHCNKEVSYSVYKRHKEMFYDCRHMEWTTLTPDQGTANNLDDQDDKVVHDAIHGTTGT